MTDKFDLHSVYVPSDNAVVREIEGELIIVPLVSGMADLEDDLFTLNKTGIVIWRRLDGKKNVKEIIEDLSDEFEGSPEEIAEDVIGFLQELQKRKIIIAA